MKKLASEPQLVRFSVATAWKQHNYPSAYSLKFISVSDNELKNKRNEGWKKGERRPVLRGCRCLREVTSTNNREN